MKIYFHFYLLIMMFSSLELTENCVREYPIIESNQCKLIYCTKEQFESKICQINNSIIRTQWLNNIINIEKISFRYINFASYSNGDMIFQTGTYPKSDFRIFFGIKKDGNCFFTNKSTNQRTYFYSLNSYQSENNNKYDSENIVINLSGKQNRQKEYLMSISKENSFVEIYDFQNDKIYQKHLYEFSNLKYINSYRHASIPLISNSSDYYYLFGFIGNTSNFEEKRFIIQIHKFNSIENFNQEQTSINTAISEMAFSESSGLSCFQTVKKVIICFFFNINKNYKITAYDINLKEINSLTLDFVEVESFKSFYKCIHLKEELGIFAYYSYFSDFYYPVLLFNVYEEKSNDIVDYIIPSIVLNKFEDKIFTYILSNDIIKINENKICFCLASQDKKKIFIIVINLFNKKNYRIRYYLIEMWNLYGHMFFDEMKMHNFNNFIAFGFNNYNKTNYGKYYDYSSSLLIFSYANSTNNNIYIDKYLWDNSNLNNISINLEKYLTIENNIFGYIFSGVVIDEIINCQNLILFSSISNNKIILDYILKKNEIIKVEFSGNNYDAFICNLKYRFKIKPDIELYNNYPVYIQENNDEKDFNIENEEYIGKSANYNIILNQSYTRDCRNIDCYLCLKKNNSFCIICKYNFTFSNEEKHCLENVEVIKGIKIIKKDIKYSKEELVENLQYLINSLEIGENYEMIGEDYNIIIKPTDVIIPNSSNVNFSSCENILRNHYNISFPRILTFVQLELKNNDSQSLINNIGYQVYDDNKNILDLSVCEDENIQIFYLINSNSSIDISFISSFKKLNIDILNIKDDFFNDKCIAYSDSENDLILKDRIIDIYQNYSLCDEGCTYINSNMDLMIITCDCKVKNNLTTNIPSINLIQLKNIKKSLGFEIIKCYELVFSLKNKANNIGFFIFLFLVILNILFLCIYFCKGIKSIKFVLYKEMIEYGYMKERANKNRRKKESFTKKEVFRTNHKNSKKSLKKYISFDDKSQNSDIRSKSNSKTIIRINNKINNKIKNNSLRKRKQRTVIGDKNLLKEKILNCPQREIYKDKKKEIHIFHKKGIKVNYLEKTIISNKNLKSDLYIKNASNHILNIYTFKEAKQKDMRSFCRIYYIYLISKQAFFYAFFYRSPLVLFPLRFCLLIFIISSDFALNAIFYFDDKISEKYRLAKNFFLFAFSNNITIILLSILIGFIILTLFIKLSNSINNIIIYFTDKDEKMKKDKVYKITDKRKNEIQKEIEIFLKKYKTKVIILIVIELILMLFFWYYVTSFCHVYPSTQKSWLWDSFLSILSRLIIELLTSLSFAKLYRIAIESNIDFLYKIALFFYSFC